MTVKKTPSRKRSPKTPAESKAQKPNSGSAEGSAKSAAAKNAAASPQAMAPAPAHQDVADLAYTKFEAHGHVHGRDLEDWVEAERELLASQAGGGKPSTPKR